MKGLNMCNSGTRAVQMNTDRESVRRWFDSQLGDTKKYKERRFNTSSDGYQDTKMTVEKPHLRHVLDSKKKSKNSTEQVTRINRGKESVRLWFGSQLGGTKKYKENGLKTSGDVNQKTKMTVKKPHVLDLKTKLKTAIEQVAQLSPSLWNVKMSNSTNLVTCGLIRNNGNLVVFAENTVVKVAPLQYLVESMNSRDDRQINHVKFVNHKKQVCCVALCPQNDILCTGSVDRTVCIYSVSKLQFIKRLFGHLGPVYCLAISENCKYLASGSHDSTIRIWTVKSGKLLRLLAGHTEAITSLHFHPNSMYLATASVDRVVRVWCIQKANTLRMFSNFKKEIYSVAFSPNGQYLASAGEDRKIVIWDLNIDQVACEFDNWESIVLHLLWAKDSKSLCVGTLVGEVKMWQIVDKNSTNIPDEEQKKSRLIMKAKVHGRLLSLDNTLAVWSCLSIKPS